MTATLAQPSTDRRSIALAHDYLLTPRGAERTFEAMAEVWPGAPVYTSLFDSEAMLGRFRGHAITTSRLQSLRPSQKSFRALLPAFPRAFEGMSLSDRDVVVSSSSAFAHGIGAPPPATHICYCHSPFRYAWHEFGTALQEAPRRLRGPMARLLLKIRDWDLRAASRVTHYIANSAISQQRIAEFYNRDSAVIHPPVDVDRFARPRSPDDYFAIVGEVTGHKRTEQTLRAARRAGRKVVVIGDGPERERLERQYAGTAEFRGRVSDAQLEEIVSRAQALVVANVEEFGIAAVEAMAMGRPVLAPRRGGTAETVVDGLTGILVEPGDEDAYAEAMREVDFATFDGSEIAAHAQKFSRARFQRELTEFVESATS